MTATITNKNSQSFIASYPNNLSEDTKEIIKHATDSLGFLVEHNKTITFKEWSNLIREYYDNPSTNAMADVIGNVGNL